MYKTVHFTRTSKATLFFFSFYLLNYSSGSRRCNLIGKTSLDSRNEITPTTIQNLTRSTRQSSGSEGESLTRTANTGKTLRHYANLASILILNTKTSSSSFSRKFYVWITKTCVQVQPAEASLWKQIFLAFEYEAMEIHLYCDLRQFPLYSTCVRIMPRFVNDVVTKKSVHKSK